MFVPERRRGWGSRCRDVLPLNHSLQSSTAVNFSAHFLLKCVSHYNAKSVSECTTCNLRAPFAWHEFSTLNIPKSWDWRGWSCIQSRPQKIRGARCTVPQSFMITCSCGFGIGFSGTCYLTTLLAWAAVVLPTSTVGKFQSIVTKPYWTSDHKALWL